MRRKDREVTEIGEILQIVKRAKILHLGLLDEEGPYVVPLHYGYEYVGEKHELLFFMHSAKEGHKLDLIRKNPNGCVELECDIELISGGENPCNYGASFASVMGKAQVELVEEPEEKIRGLKLLMKNQTGREFDVDAGMAASVAVMKASVTEFTAKSRPNESRANAERENRTAE